MRNLRRSRLRAAAMLVVLGLVLAACSSDDDASSSTPPTTESSLTKSELVVAIALNGFSPKPYTENAAKVWESWANANGGVNGHPVRIVVVDTKDDPTVAQSEVKKVIAEDKPIAFVGTNDQTITSWFDQTVAAGIPSIGGPCFYATVVCSGPGASPLYFSATTTIPAITQSSMVNAKQNGATKFAGVVCAEVAACAAIEPVYAGTTEALGLEYGGLIKVSQAAPDYNAECLQLKGNDVDAVNLAVLEETAVKFAEDCAAQGYTPQWLITNGSVTKDVVTAMSEASGSRIAGGLDGAPWWSDEPQVATIRDAFATYMPDADYEADYTAVTWAAFELFRTAMANATDDPTPQDVTQAMLALKAEDLDGLLPQSMTYKANEPAPFIQCFWMFEFVDGEMTLDPGPGPSGNSVTSGDLKSDCYPAPPEA
jgi:branched-chain amino acid transport system substrate-binding protein